MWLLYRWASEDKALSSLALKARVVLLLGISSMFSKVEIEIVSKDTNGLSCLLLRGKDGRRYMNLVTGYHL